jgi:hypothetical protein
LNSASTAGRHLNRETPVKNDIAANGISVLNNPFTNYIDVKFYSTPRSKVKFVLYDANGLPVFTKENGINQNPYRLYLSNKIIKSGVYFLSAEVNEDRYRATVIHH